MNCKFCIWFEMFEPRLDETINIGCRQSIWAGHILDPSKPPCNGTAWSQKNGLQIIYVPMHISIHEINHPESEPGFVYSKPGVSNEEFIFCRYWNKTNKNELRTKANSEATPIWRLVVKDTRPQEFVVNAIKEIENGI